MTKQYKNKVNICKCYMDNEGHTTRCKKCVNKFNKWLNDKNKSGTFTWDYQPPAKMEIYLTRKKANE